MRPTLCLDFDGCIHSYTSGWQGMGHIPDPPVPGAMEWIEKATRHWTISVYSSRSAEKEGIDAMRHYILAHLCAVFGEAKGHVVYSELRFPTTKPSALLSIDDRAITFQGNWEALDPRELLKFMPWNRRPDKAGLYQISRDKAEVVHLELSVPTTVLSWTKEAALEFAQQIIEAAGESNGKENKKA